MTQYKASDNHQYHTTLLALLNKKPNKEIYDFFIRSAYNYQAAHNDPEVITAIKTAITEAKLIISARNHRKINTNDTSRTT